VNALSRSSHDAYPSSGRVPKIALVSIGIGRTQRGYERYFGDLFAELESELDITLYKGAGDRSVRQRIPLLLGPAALAARVLPLGSVVGGAEYRFYKHDCVAYGLALLPDLMFERFDVVHVIDYPLMRVLEYLQRIFPFPAQILYTNGCCMPPHIYPRRAHVHHVAKPLFNDALAWGIPASRMTLVPCGIRTERFAIRTSPQQLRQKYGISESTFLILAVTAIKRMHKRVDHLIEEVSRIDGDLLLWIDGHEEDPAILEIAHRKLGSRCRISCVHSSDVGELYKIADVMVHGSLEESFGLAIIEGLSTGLPVLVHNSPHFEWLVQDPACLVDMKTPGELCIRLRKLLGARGGVSRSQVRADRIRSRFDWTSLKSDYIEMYSKLAVMKSAAYASA
jgi:glycosyltransferase involved in cell wall biosynthesis